MLRIVCGITLAAAVAGSLVDAKAGCFGCRHDDCDDCRPTYTTGGSERAEYRYVERAPAVRYVETERAPAVRYVEKERAPAVRYVESERAPAGRYIETERAPAVRYVERAPERASDCGSLERAADCGGAERSQESAALTLLANPVVQSLLVRILEAGLGRIETRHNASQPNPDCPEASQDRDSSDAGEGDVQGHTLLERQPEVEKLAAENRQLHKDLKQELSKLLTKEQLDEALRKNNEELTAKIVSELRRANEPAPPSR